MRCTLGLIAAAALVAAVPAAAQERSIWVLVVNEEPRGDIEIVLTPEGPWVDPEAIVAAGVRALPEGERRVFPPETRARVSLASLAPAITFELDETEIRLLLSADPSLLSSTDVAISNPRPPGWAVRSNNAAFLNYSVDWSTDSKWTGYSEFGLHLFGALFNTTASVNDAGEVIPGLTSLTIDQVHGRRRWAFGDTIGRSTTLGSAPVVGGFSLSTETSIDPYYTLFPSPQVQGAVRTPTTADLYVNGRLVSSVRLPPGQFTLRDLPIESGFGNASVILRDAFGRQRTINLGFYLSTQLLKRGEQDYSYVAGWERTIAGTTVEYGRPLGTAFHAVGVADWLTLGFQAEGAEDLAMGGAGFHLRLWRLGTFGLEALASQSPSQATGYAATGVYSFFSRLFSGDFRGTWVGPRFRNLFLEPADHEQVTADGSLTTSLGWFGSLTVGATLGGPDAFAARTTQVIPDAHGRVYMPPPTALQTSISSEDDRLLRLGYSTNLTSRIQLSLNATKTYKPSAPATWEGFASLTFALGWRTTASTLTTVDPDGQALTTVNLQRSLPNGPGFGFRIDADAQEPYRSQGVFEVQTRRAVVGVRADASQGSKTVGTINLAGSIVAIGGEVLLSRPVDDGFALVKVPEAKGVRVLANNQEEGRTGRRGSLFVPNLQSYLSNPISIVQDDVPVDVKLGEIEHVVVVPYRGGAVVTFEATRIRAVAGRLEVAGAQPSYGTMVIEVAGQRFSSPLNVTGEFYFEDLPPGDHAAIATWEDRSCRATVRIAKRTESMIDLGVIPCLEEAK